MDAVSFGRLELPVITQEYGWALSLSDRTPLEAIGWVLNYALRGEFGAFREIIADGRTTPDFPPDAYAMPVPPEEESLAELRALWTASTGLRSGDERMYWMGTSFLRTSFALPQGALIQLFDALRAGDVHPFELPSHAVPDSEPDGLDGLRLSELEQQAHELEALQATISSHEQAATVSAKRRVLLIDLEFHGLLDGSREARNRALVPPWEYPIVYGYVAAALGLAAYHRSPERARALPHVPPGPVVGGWVSLDWFRLGTPLPPDSSPFMFLAFCEHIVFTELSLRKSSGAAGEFYYRAGDRYRVRWRCDDGVHPAVLDAEMLPAR